VEEGAPPSNRRLRRSPSLARGTSPGGTSAGHGVDGRNGRAKQRHRSRPAGARLLSRSSRAWMWAGVGLGLAFFVLFGIVPAVGNLIISFTNYSGLPGSPTSFSGLSNYNALFTSQAPGFQASIIDTLIFVLGVTIVQNIVGMALAHRLLGDTKTGSLLRTFAFFPVVLGATVIGIVWLLLFDPLSSPASSFFGLFGVHSAFFGSNDLAMPLVITVQVWQNLGFTMAVYIGALKTIPLSIYEAAMLDGVTPWQRFTRVTWPLMAPAVTVNVLFAVIGSLTTYNLIYILTDGQFGTNTLGMLAFNTAFGQSADLGLGAAVTIALLVVSVAVAIPLAALFRSRERRLLA
jgi:raffinose/stachyose/melibiose transport system permease protein